MFSLLVGLHDGAVNRDRLLEHTAEGLQTWLRPDLGSALQVIPALSMPEVDDDRYEQVARIGTILNFREAGRGYRFDFVPNPNLAPIPSATIQELADKLDIDIDHWEHKRTHWAAKDVDLFQVLLEHEAQSARRTLGNFESTGAVQFPRHTARDPALVGVMMPFEASFDVVYETIEQAVEDAGLHCQRADNVWDLDHVMGDVLSLIWRAQIVVCDLTGKNPNVFYETGLAHALPRRTVLLTQNPSDVPFDLQSIRYLKYGLSTEDRASLKKRLAERLTKLAEKPGE